MAEPSNDRTFEEERLAQTLQEVDRQLERIGPAYFGDDYTEQVLDAMRQEQRAKLVSLGDSPYFGRLDFVEQAPGGAGKQRLYIGKHGLKREPKEQNGTKDSEDSAAGGAPEAGDPLVVDWRAPIASLFYSFSGGEGTASFESPEGEVQGEVHLKRNFDIRGRRIERMADNYVRGGEAQRAGDEFLLYRLEEHKDNKLRDIVSTIQAEQDRIIRAPKDRALIIQGVAGSGKTTVALHRLAYLLYHYRQTMHPERMMILAPSAMFLDYISGVLPELGVGGILQTTYVEWALGLLKDRIRLASDAKRMALTFKPGARIPKAGRIKGSLKFMRWLEAGVNRYMDEAIPESDFSPWDGAVLPLEEIRAWHDREYAHYPPAKRRERTMGRINRWMEMRLQQERGALRRDCRKSGRSRLKSYQAKWPEPSPAALYKAMFGLAAGPYRLPDDWASLWPESFRATMAKRLAREFFDAEDLPALVYLHILLHGNGGQRFDHVVIDEAQDVSPLQIETLNRFMREPSMTILGDLGQAIYEYKGIRDWREILRIFPEERRLYYEMIRSYRSTTEIIEFADRILTQAELPLPRAVPVFRSGDEVRVEAGPDRRAAEAAVIAYVRKRLDDSSTVAVLARTAEDSERYWEALREAGVEVCLVTGEQPDYSGGVSVMPAYLSKGLEFDSVLVCDADAANYPGDALHAKLLYVACTRALHRLQLIHIGAPSPLLSGRLPASTESASPTLGESGRDRSRVE